MENRTYTRFTVRVLCIRADVMADVQVIEEDMESAFRIAEKQHDNDCGSSIGSAWFPCGAEGFSIEDGWETN